MLKFPDLLRSDPEWFVFEWQDRLAQEWRAGELVQVGAVRRPAVPTGYYLVCTTAGQCGHRHPYVPTLPGQEGETVQDGGGVTWELTLPGSANVPSVASCTYSIEPEGIEVDDDEIVTALAQSRVRLNAEYAEPGCYVITATMIDSNGEEHFEQARVRVV